MSSPIQNCDKHYWKINPNSILKNNNIDTSASANSAFVYLKMNLRLFLDPVTIIDTVRKPGQAVE